MGWNTIPDKSTGDLFTEAMWDTFFKGNAEYLLNGRGLDAQTYIPASDYSTTSSSWQYVDSTNAKVSVDCYSGRVLVAAGFHSGGSSAIDGDVGFRANGVDYEVGVIRSGVTDFVCVAWIISGLATDGSQEDIYLRYKSRVAGNAVVISRLSGQGRIWMVALEI
jgi:hypothetical protein